MKFKHGIQEFIGQLGKTKRVLIAPASPITLDRAGAASALALFLNRFEKDVEVLALKDYEKEYDFLPKTGKLRTSLGVEDALVMVLDTTKKTLGEVSYVQESGKTKIFLKSKSENFLPSDVSFETEKTPYDLIIIIGAQDLEGLGASFENNTEIFYNTPKVNIDNHPGNKNFGAINLVNINAVSLSEILTEVVQALKADLINEDVATCLLSGIIAQTNSFQHPKVTPQSFLKASELVSRGAKQQEIIRALFKTKPLPLLKLWGRSLARLKEQDNAAVSVLNRQDYEKAEASEDLLPRVHGDLVENMPQKNIIAFLVQTTDKLLLFLGIRHGLQVENLVQQFGSGENFGMSASGSHEVHRFILEGINMEEAQGKLGEFLSSLGPKIS